MTYVTTDWSSWSRTLQMKSKCGRSISVTWNQGTSTIEAVEVGGIDIPIDALLDKLADIGLLHKAANFGNPMSSSFTRREYTDGEPPEGQKAGVIK